MNEKLSLPSLKQKLAILLLFISILTLSCNSPDVAKMVIDYFMDPTLTAEARQKEKEDFRDTEAAKIYKTIDAQNTERAQRETQIIIDTVAAREKTFDALDQTSVALDRTQRAINFDNTMAAKLMPTPTAEPRPPVIVSIRFPKEITKNIRADGYIDFHDINGNVNRITFTAVKAEVWTPFELTPAERIVSGNEYQGTIKFSITCGYCQYLKLKITLTDTTGLSSPGVVFSTTCKP